MSSLKFWYELQAFGIICETQILIYMSPKVAAQPNICHVVVDESDPHIKTAEVHRISRVSKHADQDVPVWELPSHGSHLSFESALTRPTEVSKTQNASDTGHVHGWSGDTLVASEAKEYVNQYNAHALSREDGEHNVNTFTTPRRLFPTLRSGASPTSLFGENDSFAKQLYKTPPIASGLEQSPQCYPIDVQPGLTNINTQDIVSRSSSDGTVKVHSLAPVPESPIHQSEEALNRSVIPGSPGLEMLKTSSSASSPCKRQQTDTQSRLGLVKRIKITKRPVGKRPWQSPSQEDFSPQTKYRMGPNKPPWSSPTRQCTVTTSNIEESNTPGRTSHLTRPGSSASERSTCDRYNCDPSTSTKLASFNQGRSTGGCARGRKTYPTLNGSFTVPARSRNGARHITCPDHQSQSAGCVKNCPCSKEGAVMLSQGVLNGIDNFGCLHAIHGDLQESRCSAKYGLSSPVAVEHGFEDAGYEASLDTACSEKQKFPFSRKVSHLSSPDTSNRPWNRRDITSSRWFPLETQLIEDSRMDPSWKKVDGKLCIMFPSRIVAAMYEVEVHATIYLSGPDNKGWYGFSIPRLPSLHQSQPSGRLSFFNIRGPAVIIDRSFLDNAEDSGPYLILGGSHFGSSQLLRLYFPFPENHQLKNDITDKKYNPPAFECSSSSNAVSLLAAAGLADPKLQPYSRIVKPTAPMRCPVKPADVAVETEAEAALSKCTKEQTQLSPFHFAGLHTQDDPLQPEDPKNLAWNLDMRIGRVMTGELECQMGLEVQSGTAPLLLVDARGWNPNFSLINGRLAHRGEWRETEVGDMALYSLGFIGQAETTKVDIYWREFYMGDDPAAYRSTRAEGYRLPNIIDKVVLNGKLTCNIDNAVTALDDGSMNEDFSWRADCVVGCNSVGLPKLYPGYSMHIKTAEENALIGEVLGFPADMADVNAPDAPDLQIVNKDSQVSKQATATSSTQTVGAILPQPEAGTTTPNNATSSISGPTMASYPPRREPTALNLINVISRALITSFPFSQFATFCMLAALFLHIFGYLSPSPQEVEFYDDVEGVRLQEGRQGPMSDVTERLLFRQIGVEMSPKDREVEADAEARNMKWADEGAEGYIWSVNPKQEQEAKQKVTEEQSWRDMIDRALGWREGRD